MLRNHLRGIVSHFNHTNLPMMDVTVVFEVLQVPPTMSVVKDRIHGVPRDGGVFLISGPKGRSQLANKVWWHREDRLHEYPGGRYFFCSHRSRLPNRSQSHKLPFFHQPPRLRPFLSIHCWFTHQFILLIVHLWAQLLQSKAASQTHLAPPWAFCGCQSSTAGRVRWELFYPMHKGILQWPMCNRDPSLRTASDPTTSCKMTSK